MCEEVGEPAPLSFQVEFWEQDSIGFPYGFCLPASGAVGPGRHVGLHHASCPNATGFNDFIGRARIDYSTQELEVGLPHVGDEVIETVRLDACPAGWVCGDGPGPWNVGDYTFTWRVTRLPDVRVDFRAVLDEAMQRSGAGSELEAIATGLRSLRAPSPRKIEPETGNPSPGR